MEVMMEALGRKSTSWIARQLKLYNMLNFTVSKPFLASLKCLEFNSSQERPLRILQYYDGDIKETDTSWICIKLKLDDETTVDDIDDLLFDSHNDDLY